MELEKLRFPIGRFSPPKNYTPEFLASCIADIENTPEQYAQAVEGLSDEQLDTPYRPDGWTLRQVVHHVVDSHMNSYIRFKWTLTEDTPTIKAYDEKLWAEEPEAKNAPIQLSIDLLKALHVRWVLVLKNLSEEDLEKELDDLYEKYPVSGEINYQVENADATLIKVEEYFNNFNPKSHKLDGISMDFGNWAFNLRKSNTQPLVRLNIEGISKEVIAENFKKIEKIIGFPRNNLPELEELR